MRGEITYIKFTFLCLQFSFKRTGALKSLFEIREPIPFEAVLVPSIDPRSLAEEGIWKYPEFTCVGAMIIIAPRMVIILLCYSSPPPVFAPAFSPLPLLHFDAVFEMDLHSRNRLCR
jgi:hypothetical protein